MSPCEAQSYEPEAGANVMKVGAAEAGHRNAVAHFKPRTTQNVTRTRFAVRIYNANLLLYVASDL